MNNFSAIDAQSDLSALIQVAPNEAAHDDAAPNATPCEHKPRYGVNIAKLTAHNLRQPLHKRIALADLTERVNFAHVRGALAGLHGQISAEVAPVLRAMRGQSDALMGW